MQCSENLSFRAKDCEIKRFMCSSFDIIYFTKHLVFLLLLLLHSTSIKYVTDEVLQPLVWVPVLHNKYVVLDLLLALP